MPAQLTDAAKELLQKPFICNLATLNPDGWPQVTPVWIDLDGDQVLINTAEARKKTRNLYSDPRIGLDVVDPQSAYNVLSLQGRVVAMEHEGADAHINKLTKKYLGKDIYPFRRPDEQRVILRIEVVRILMQPGEG